MGTEIIAAQIRPAGVHRADAFTVSPLPEKGTGKGFFFNMMLSKEEFSLSGSTETIRSSPSVNPVRNVQGRICSCMLMISPMVLQLLPQRRHTKDIVQYPCFPG